MVKLNPLTGLAVKGQNEALIQSLGIYKDKYDEQVINAALKALQDPNFLSEGLLKLLLSSLQNGLDITKIQDGSGKLSDPAKKELDKLAEKLKEAQTSTSTELAEIKNSVKLASSDFSRTSERVLQRLQENEFNGTKAAVLTNMKITIEEIRKRYLSDLGYLQGAVADGHLTYEEKLKVSYLLNVLKTEYPSTLKEIQSYNVDTHALEASYRRLMTYIGSLYLDKNTKTVIDGTYFLTTFSSYYDDLLAALEEMMKTATGTFNKIIDKTVATLASSTDISGNLLDANNVNHDIQRFLETALADEELSLSELEHLLRTYYRPLIETLYPRALATAKAHKRDSSGLEGAKTSLQNLVESLELFSLPLKTKVIAAGTPLLSKFLDYYQEEINLYTALQATVQEKLKEAKEEVRQYSTTLNQTNKELELGAKEVKMVGNVVQTTQANLKVLSDSINSTVKRVTLDRDLATSNAIVNGDSFNLYTHLKSQAGFIEPATKSILPSVNGSHVSEEIPVTGGLEYTASLWSNSIENTIWIYWLGEKGKVLKVDKKTSTDPEFHLTVSAPTDAKTAQLVTYQTKDSHLQFQVGSTATSYRASAYDSLHNVLLAQGEVADKEHDLDVNTSNYNTFLTDHLLIEQRLTELMKDFTFSPDDKPELNEILQKLANQYRYISDKMSSYLSASSLSTLDSAILTLTEFTNSVFDTDGPYVIASPDNVKRDYKAFFKESKKLLETLNDLLIKDIEEAKKKLAASTKNALDAETLRNDVKRDMEQVASKLTSLQKFKEDEISYKREALDGLFPLMDDNVITAVEKVTLNELIGRIKVEDNWYQETADKLNVGKAAFVGAKNELLDLANPMLTLNELYSSSTIDKEVLTTKLEAYFREKELLLEKILASYTSQYALLQNQYSAAYNQYELKNEELLRYQEAVTEAKKQIRDLSESIDNIKRAVQYTVRLTSSRGEIFTNGNISTRLEAQFLKNGIDFTDNLRPSDIIWSKTHGNGEPDEDWNGRHVNAGRFIDLTEADVQQKAIFKVQIYELLE